MMLKLKASVKYFNIDTRRFNTEWEDTNKLTENKMTGVQINKVFTTN